MRHEAAPEGDETVYIDREDSERGSKGPFFVAYTDADGDHPWGYLCGNCDSFDNAMDTMGRVECNTCGNLRKPDQWDAAHE